MIPHLLEIQQLRAAFSAGLKPEELIDTLYDRIAAYSDPAVFIALVPHAEARAAARAVNPSLPLAGIPFVVKDNIDVAGMPTTAACPDFAYTALVDATCVGRLRAAGAILLGKTNLDQFATGLNGTRSPFGAPRCVFNADYIAGGSSSGSAVAVAAGLAAFSLGTDTAGSGRVPAACNNIFGLKPSIGLIPTRGVVPACKSLDCVSIFANSPADAVAVLAEAHGFDQTDAYSRAAQAVALPLQPKLGILATYQRDFVGDDDAAKLYEATIQHAIRLGWVVQPIDYTPFRAAASLLYEGAFVAERLAAIRDFYLSHPASFDPTVRAIINGTQKFSAADLFADIHKLQALRQITKTEMSKVDALLLPTAPTTFTVEQMLAHPIINNSTLGLYTNFVNLLDLAAIALPVGFRPNGLPFGVSLIGPAFSEASLAALATSLHTAVSGSVGINRTRTLATSAAQAPGTVTLVVAGAHLSGMALNHELTALGATLVCATRTAQDYQLFALQTTPPKPGLVHRPGFIGSGIAVELWSLSPENFGRFVAALPAPMGIGRVTLADGTTHPGFLCETYALDRAIDITAYGGWRAFRDIDAGE
ncbi:allophanate hydrolase [Acidiphilium sp. MT5]